MHVLGAGRAWGQAAAGLDEGGAEVLEKGLRVEGLLDVEDGAELVGGVDVAVVAAGGQHDDGDVLRVRVGLEAPEDLMAAELRHHEIEENGGGLLDLGENEAFLAVGRGHDPESLPLKDQPAHLEQRRLVIHQQDRHTAILPRRARLNHSR